jgi:hypothetical protein
VDDTKVGVIVTASVRQRHNMVNGQVVHMLNPVFPVGVLTVPTSVTGGTCCFERTSLLLPIPAVASFCSSASPAGCAAFAVDGCHGLVHGTADVGHLNAGTAALIFVARTYLVHRFSSKIIT